MKMRQTTAKPPAVRGVAFVVAVIATSSSIAICVLAGLERGGTAAEQWIWIAMALALLLSAHLIPAMARDAKPVVRIVALFLWLAAMVSTGYTHGTFFLAAQQHAGALRAKQVRVPDVARDEASTRDSITSLLRQQARLQGALNQSALVRCVADCRALTLRRQTLRDQLDSIKGQLDEARRAEQADDRQATERARALARQDEQRGDPVSTRLSGWLRVPAPTLDLALAIFFGWLLESVACFSWSIALSGTRSRDLPAENFGVNAPTQEAIVEKVPLPMHHSFVVGAAPQAANDSRVIERESERSEETEPQAEAAIGPEKVDSDAERAEEDDEARLREALEAGIATNSIADITRVLQCSDGRALALRRKIAVTSPQLLVVGSTG
jgi:hypothetical protein